MARELSSSPKSDIYIVDTSHNITKNFYNFAKCWLDKGSLEQYSNGTDYSKLKAKRLEFILSHKMYKESNFDKSKFYQSVVITILEQCADEKCDGKKQMEKIFTGFRVVRVGSSSDVRHIFAGIITDDIMEKRESSNGIQLYDEKTLAAALRMAGMCVLAFVFCVISISIFCQSLFLFSFIYDDYCWRRENIEVDGFQGVPQQEVKEDHPLCSPAPTLQTAVSQTSIEIDDTQDSHTEKSLQFPSILSFN